MDKDRVLGEEQSAPSAENSAALAAGAAEMRCSTFLIKVADSAERFAASKLSLMRDSDALLEVSSGNN